MEEVGPFEVNSEPRRLVDDIRSTGKSKGDPTRKIVWSSACFKYMVSLCGFGPL